ncbi:MAG: arylsulfatase [Planctomycetota bacterium]
MNHHILFDIRCFLLLALLCVFAAQRETIAASGKPNFLIIVADDMGFSDAGCYGGEIATPHLDALAAGGLRFTQFYNTARCWPTRAALLSGYYPQQIRRDSMPGVDPAQFGGQGVRPGWARLIPEQLRPLGYRSYHSGKWHIDGKPTENGFDRSYHIKRLDSFFYADAHDKDDVPLPPTEPDSGFFATVAVADHAIECLQEHAREYAGRPFFHYLAFFAPHFPLHAQQEDIARYRDRYLEGWDTMRNERHARQREMGIVDTALSALEPDIGPPYDFPEQIAQLGPGEINRLIPWEQLTDQQRRFQATKMAIHAAMVDRLDCEIGRVLDQLRKMDVLDNTVIMFLSDNGASAEMMVRGCGHDPSLPMGSNKTYLCLGAGFSSTANTPFRRHKTWVHEGGISTPFIVHWAKGIAGKDQLRTTPAHVIDIAPTVLDLAGAKPTADRDAPPVPGVSLAQTFEEDGPPLHEAIWFYHEGNWALRQGDWKIVHEIGTRPFPWQRSAAAANEGTIKPDWKLYNLAIDRAEQHDLASQHPERVQRMAQLWFQWRDQFMRDAMTVEK